ERALRRGAGLAPFSYMGSQRLLLFRCGRAGRRPSRYFLKPFTTLVRHPSSFLERLLQLAHAQADPGLYSSEWRPQPLGDFHLRHPVKTSQSDGFPLIRRRVAKNSLHRALSFAGHPLLIRRLLRREACLQLSPRAAIALPTQPPLP